MENLLHDFRYAARRLLRTPGFTAVVAITLGVGVGVNSALFSVLNRLLLRHPDAVANPDGVVRVYILPPLQSRGLQAVRQGASYPDYVLLSEHRDVFSKLAAYSGVDISLDGGAEAGPGRVVLVSGNYFDMLGVRAHLGRVLDESNVADRNDHSVAVLSYGFWQRRFGGNPNALGERLTVNGARLTVVGVAQRGFSGVDVDSPDMWLPLAAVSDIGVQGRQVWTGGAAWLRLIGRLQPGLGRQGAAERARIALNPGTGTLISERPESFSRVALEDLSFFTTGSQGAGPVPVWMLSVTTFVLLIACANTANLLLIRAAARDRELALRLSLGASRQRLIRQLLVEALLLAFLGACVGLLLTAWSVQLFRILSIPRMAHLLDTRVLIFTVGLAVLTVALFGLFPALRASDIHASTALQMSGYHADVGRSRLREGLVVLQIVLSSTLLVGTALLIRSLHAASAVNPGFDLKHILTATIPLRSSGYGDQDAWELYQRAMERVTSLGGIESASYGRMKPFYSFSFMRIRIQGQDEAAGDSPTAFSDVVDTSYFRTLRIPVRAGRTFTLADREGAERVVVINEAMANAYWPGRNPVGECFIVEADCLRIIGVVGDTRYTDLRRDPAPQYYESLAQHAEGKGSLVLLIRTRDAPSLSVSRIRTALQSLDQKLPYVSIAQLSDAADALMKSLRVSATLLTLLGTLALLLSGVGLYGVMASTVWQRRHELGVRMAMGATPLDICSLVLKQGLRLTLIGLTLGLPTGLMLARLLSSQLFGVRPTDLGSHLTTIAVLTIAGLAASCIPAMRAARMDPALPLRSE